MPAPIGNTNASKWTLETTLAKIQLIEDYTEDNERCLQLGRALRHAGVYIGIWSYWKHKWADNADIMDRMGMIEQEYIDRISDGAMSKRLHGGVCIFILKVNYGLTDKVIAKEEKKEEDSPEKQAAILKQQEREKERMHLKVLAHNAAHPDQALPLGQNYIDEPPASGAGIAFHGGFFLEF